MLLISSSGNMSYLPAEEIRPAKIDYQKRSTVVGQQPKVSVSKHTLRYQQPTLPIYYSSQVYQRAGTVDNPYLSHTRTEAKL